MKAYAFKLVRQPLTTDFTQTSKSRFNFEEMLKSWMHQPSKFSKRSDELYPVTWFKEPYSLFATMICRLYGLPNCSVLKTEWAPVAHHVLATGDSFPWASMLSLELKNSIEDYQKATAKKKPNFFFSAFIYDIFCTEFQYPNL